MSECNSNCSTCNQADCESRKQDLTGQQTNTAILNM